VLRPECGQDTLCTLSGTGLAGAIAPVLADRLVEASFSGQSSYNNKADHLPESLLDKDRR
jgi:hypothetical protein